MIWPCSVQPPPPGPSTPSIPHQETNIKKSLRGPVLRRELGTAHIFLACAWERGHGTAPALLRGSQGLLQTHDGHLAAVSEPTAWAGRQAGRGGCWHRAPATGEVGTGLRVAFFHMHCGIQEGNFFLFFFFWKENPPALLLLFFQAVPASLNCK